MKRNKKESKMNAKTNSLKTNSRSSESNNSRRNSDLDCK